MTDDLNTPSEALAVMQAVNDGKAIELFDYQIHDWIDADEDNLPDFANYRYRAKPIVREFWLLVRTINNDIIGWEPNELAAMNLLAHEEHMGYEIEVIHVKEVLSK